MAAVALRPAQPWELKSDQDAILPSLAVLDDTMWASNCTNLCIFTSRDVISVCRRTKGTAKEATHHGLIQVRTHCHKPSKPASIRATI